MSSSHWQADNKLVPVSQGLEAPSNGAKENIRPRLLYLDWLAAWHCCDGATWYYKTSFIKCEKQRADVTGANKNVWGCHLIGILTNSSYVLLFLYLHCTTYSDSVSCHITKFRL